MGARSSKLSMIRTSIHLLDQNLHSALHYQYHTSFDDLLVSWSHWCWKCHSSETESCKINLVLSYSERVTLVLDFPVWMWVDWTSTLLVPNNFHPTWNLIFWWNWRIVLSKKDNSWSYDHSWVLIQWTYFAFFFFLPEWCQGQFFT